MRLKNIILINRAPFERLELDFDEKNVVVLSGVNGTGKTTIISYIVDAFYELAKNAFTVEFEDKLDKFYRISSSTFSLDSSKTSIVYLRFIKDNGTYADYVDIRENCTQETYEMEINISNKIPFTAIEDNLKVDGFVKYWSLCDVKENRSVFHENLLTYFPAYRYEEPSYLNDPYKFNLNFRLKSKFTGYLPNPIEVTSDLKEIANWIMDIVLDIRQDSNISKVQASFLFGQLNDILTKILSSKFHCKMRLGVGPRFYGSNRIGIMNGDKEAPPIYPNIFNMSSGELALLCLFGELLKQSDTIRKTPIDVFGIVLVDEIDKHLHIRLQKEILPKLIEMFPKLQFIVSSHSPFLSLGLEESQAISPAIYDLDKNGIICSSQDNQLFKEAYDVMIAQNERYYVLYEQLKENIQNSTKPMIITEGKTDWKHLKAAMNQLGIHDLDVYLYEDETGIGDEQLYQVLTNCAKIPNEKMIIGMFDRDNAKILNKKHPVAQELGSREYVSFGNQVYGFAIPLVNNGIYGNEISIEHYYNKDNLTKNTPEGRRLFLGSEFNENGVGCDGKYRADGDNIKNKVAKNGIIDEKVYLYEDLKGTNSLALSKNDFADLILKQDDFVKDFDFSQFEKIFAVIRKIIAENKP